MVKMGGMNKKEDDSDWEEFEEQLEESLKTVNEEENDYNKIKVIPFKKNEQPFFNAVHTFTFCNNCNDESNHGKFCSKCGSKLIIFRHKYVCHDCKRVINGDYCSECGKGEFWELKKKEEADHRKKEEERRKKEEEDHLKQNKYISKSEENYIWGKPKQLESPTYSGGNYISRPYFKNKKKYCLSLFVITLVMLPILYGNGYFDNKNRNFVGGNWSLDGDSDSTTSYTLTGGGLDEMNKRFHYLLGESNILWNFTVTFYLIRIDIEIDVKMNTEYVIGDIEETYRIPYLETILKFQAAKFDPQFTLISGDLWQLGIQISAVCTDKTYKYWNNL